MSGETAITRLVRDELSMPVDPRAASMAAALAAEYAGAARAVLFYGSCLRETQLDGLMLDFYLIVSDYRAAYDRRWLAAANRLIPPNVFPFQHGGLIAKYAVLSEADFHRLCGPETRNVSVWARFAQPSRLLWSADAPAADRAVAAVARAAPTLLWSTLPFDPVRHDRMQDDMPPSSLPLWKAAFTRTYSAELRSEKSGRSLSVVDADPERYARFSGPALAAISVRVPTATRAGWQWRYRRLSGKALSVLRLAKASLTYAGGIDYLAWKINRHAGTQIEIQPWQRRWPLVAALTLVPKLLRSGAIR